MTSHGSEVQRDLLRFARFLSDHGVRALSRFHEDTRDEIDLEGQHLVVKYLPAESDSVMFGRNSLWRGPEWFPVHILLLKALELYRDVYGDAVKVECPTGSGNLMNLRDVQQESARRLCHGDEERYIVDPYWRDLVRFSKYFCGDTGRGAGASHQTGWTALAATCRLRVKDRDGIFTSCSSTAVPAAVVWRCPGERMAAKHVVRDLVGEAVGNLHLDPLHPAANVIA